MTRTHIENVRNESENNVLLKELNTMNENNLNKFNHELKCLTNQILIEINRTVRNIPIKKLIDPKKRDISVRLKEIKSNIENLFENENSTESKKVGFFEKVK